MKPEVEAHRATMLAFIWAGILLLLTLTSTVAAQLAPLGTCQVPEGVEFKKICTRPGDCNFKGCYSPEGQRLGECVDGGCATNYCSGGPCDGRACSEKVGEAPGGNLCNVNLNCDKPCRFNPTSGKCSGYCEGTELPCFSDLDCTDQCTSGTDGLCRITKRECDGSRDHSNCKPSKDRSCNLATCSEAVEARCLGSYECGPHADLEISQECTLTALTDHWTCVLSIVNHGPDQSKAISIEGVWLGFFQDTLTQDSCGLTIIEDSGSSSLPTSGRWRFFHQQLASKDSFTCSYTLQRGLSRATWSTEVHSQVVLDHTLQNNQDSGEIAAPFHLILQGDLVSALDSGGDVGGGYRIGIGSQPRTRLTAQVIAGRWDLGGRGRRETSLEGIEFHLRYALPSWPIAWSAGAGIYSLDRAAETPGIALGLGTTLMTRPSFSWDLGVELRRVDTDPESIDYLTAGLTFRIRP